MFPYRRLPGHITGLYIFTIIDFLIFCHMALVEADISVISLSTNETVIPFIGDMPAYFGGHISYEGILGQTVYADPPTGCTEIQPPPKNTTILIPGVKWFVVIMRSGCSFSKKVLNAQLAGYDVAIVHNLNSNQLEPMGPDKEKGIVIPSVFIGESDGLNIKQYFTYDKGYVLQISPDLPFSLNPYIFPFAVGVGTCLFIMMLVMIVKCIRERNRRRRHRLPTRLLKKLPIRKFKEDDPYDTCAICLDEYIKGEKLRVLPCNHTYHTKCIDPWLTESRRTCPVCKRKVLPRDRNERRNLLTSTSASDSDTDSETDGGRPSENTPLISARTRGNINLGERDVGHSNPMRIWDDEETPVATTAAASILDEASTSTASPSSPFLGGGRYQATSYGSNGSSSRSTLAVPPTDLLSSGEHSVNGEATDFTPVVLTSEEEISEESRDNSRGPVEIAIDVASRGMPSSLWNTRRETSPSKSNYDLVV